MVNGLGSAREVALTGVVFVPAAVALFPLQLAARRARPTAAAAAATRVVIVSMVPPRKPKVAMDAKRRRAHPHRGCPQGGTVASTEIMPRQRCHNQIVKRAAPRLAIPRSEERRVGKDCRARGVSA